MWATDVELPIERLDGSGAVVKKSIGYVDSWVPPKARVYFWVPLSSAEAAYRVTVHQFEWFSPGAGP